MRFRPHYLIVLLAALPELVGAQVLRTPPLAFTSPAQADEPEGEGCGNGYSGYVNSGDAPLAGASVFVKGTGIVLVTNQLGFFVLPASVVKWPTLSVSAMGYESVELACRVCEPVTIDLKVVPGTKFKKHGRKKGWIMLPKRKR